MHEGPCTRTLEHEKRLSRGGIRLSTENLGRVGVSQMTKEYLSKYLSKEYSRQREQPVKVLSDKKRTGTFEELNKILYEQRWDL